MPRYKRLTARDIEIKSKGEVVTAVDRDMEEALTAALGRLDPGARIVGEEAVELGHASMEDLQSGRLWLVDPLDGTANFADGRRPFGVIVALVQDGRTVASWLYDPLDDEMATAVLGLGAYVGDRRVQSSAVNHPTKISIAGQFMSIEQRQLLSAAAETCMEVHPIPRCAAAHYPMIANGDHDVAVFQRTLPWDHAGGALFLTEAGGCVTRWNGHAYSLSDDAVGIVAATSPTAWAMAMRTLGPQLISIETEIRGTAR